MRDPQLNRAIGLWETPSKGRVEPFAGGENHRFASVDEILLEAVGGEVADEV